MGIKEGVLSAWTDVLSPLFDEFASDIEIECLDPASPQDLLYDEGSKLYLPPVVIKGRIQLKKQLSATPAGAQETSDGQATFKSSDLEGLALGFGCRINTGGKRYQVLSVQQTSQVGDVFLLTKALLKEEP